MDSALPVKILYCFLYFALGKLLDHLFQFWVFLAHDLFELYRSHTGVLELREGPPSLNRLTRIRRVHRAVSRRYRAAVPVPDASVVWMSPSLLPRASAPRGRLARNLPPCNPRPPRLRGSRTELLSCPRLRCHLNRQPSRATERFRLLLGAATHSIPGGGLPWQCALATRPAWDRCSRADCLPASGQRPHAPCVPSRRLCTVCQH